jgi:hypothetical protein
MKVPTPPPLTGPTTLAPKALFAKQRAVLESLFPDGWFATGGRNRASHPAVVRRNQLLEYERTGGIVSSSSSIELLRAMGHALLDSYSIAVASEGDARNLHPGDFANYGNERVRARLRNVVVDAEHFGSVLAELAFAAWFLGKGWEVLATEDEGRADFCVRIDEGRQILADCKKIASNSKPQRIGKVLRAANSQIKAYGLTAYGVAAVDLSDWISDDLFEHSPDPVANPIALKVPPRVLEAEAIARCALQASNSSVNAAVLAWNQYALVGPHPQTGYTLFLLWRRSVIVEHQRPKHTFDRIPDISLGTTISFGITFPPGQHLSLF